MWSRFCFQAAFKHIHTKHKISKLSNSFNNNNRVSLLSTPSCLDPSCAISSSSCQLCCSDWLTLLGDWQLRTPLHSQKWKLTGQQFHNPPSLLSTLPPPPQQHVTVDVLPVSAVADCCCCWCWRWWERWGPSLPDSSPCWSPRSAVDACRGKEHNRLDRCTQTLHAAQRYTDIRHCTLCWDTQTSDTAHYVKIHRHQTLHAVLGYTDIRHCTLCRNTQTSDTACYADTQILDTAHCAGIQTPDTAGCAGIQTPDTAHYVEIHRHQTLHTVQGYADTRHCTLCRDTDTRHCTLCRDTLTSDTACCAGIHRHQTLHAV